MTQIIVTYEKVKSYTMPEYNWNNADEWFENVSNNIANLNNYNDLNRAFGLKVARGCQTGDNLYDALKSRIKNKNETTGLYGHGKVFENIIGEYILGIEDKTVIEQKYKSLNRILGMFNKDAELISQNPLSVKKSDGGVIGDFTKIDLDSEIRLAILLSFFESKGKVKAGQVIGRLRNKYTNIMAEKAKEIGPLVGRGIGMIGNEIKDIGDGGAEKILKKEYPNYESYLTVDDEVNTKLKESLEFYFGSGDLAPTMVYYDIDDEQYGVPINLLIKKMKHDKKAYQELNLIKPGGAKWPQSGGGKFYMILSNDPFMNMCKSTGRYWGNQSCENYGNSGTYPQGPVSDIRYGNLIVYLFKGDRPSDGWPYKQSVGSGWANKVDAADDGTLLSRQNVKWGFKENKKDVVGAGIDPAHYPSNGRKGYQANSNRAIAMVLADSGLFNYGKLVTPYEYVGHCDVGRGTGILTYTSGTSCFTKIDQMNFNPDLIVAEDPHISYYDFNRLTKPATDRKIKLLLAKNHTIWAIPENDKGISRLLASNDKDIISLMMASPIATKEAMNVVLDNLDIIQPNSDSFAAVNDNICKLLSNHPNADEEIHNKIISKHPIFDNGLTALEVFYLRLTNISETFISHLPKSKLSEQIHKFLNRKLFTFNTKSKRDYSKIIKILLGSSIDKELIDGPDGLFKERKLDIISDCIVVKNLMFAKYLTIKDYTKLLIKFKSSYHSWNTIQEHHNKYPIINELVNKTSKEVGYSYCIPLYDVNHYGWNFKSDKIEYNFGSLQNIENNILKTDRQTVGNINNIYNICPELFENGTILEYIRNKKVYEKLWTFKDKYNIDPYYFTLNSRNLEKHDIEDIAIYWDEEKLSYAFENTNKPLRAFMYKFLPYDEGKSKLREIIHTSLLNTIINSDEYISKLGIELICHWIYGDLNYFKIFEDKILKLSLKNLYSNGEFLEPPKDLIELYENIENISLLNSVAAGYDGLTGGLCRNPNIPYYIQKCLLDKWPNISKKYDGEYDEYLSKIEGALAENEGTHHSIIERLYANNKYWKQLASNPATSELILSKLYKHHPVEVLCNPSLGDRLFNNFWKLTNNILRKEVDVDVNRLNNLLKQPNDKLKGSKRRREIIKYMENATNWLGYWRGGLTKKGNFSAFGKINYYHEGIADYPIIDPLINHKIVISKFWDDKERNMENELWIIDNLIKKGKNNVLISGKMYDGKGLVEFKDRNILINDLFSHIPKYKRGNKIKSTDSEGKTIQLDAPKWSFDNIFVFTDRQKPEGESVPSWRYTWNKSDLEKIINVFIHRGTDKQISKLLKDWEHTYVVSSGLTPKGDWATLNQSSLIKSIDDNNLWTPTIIGITLKHLLKNNSKIYTTMCNNMPLTKTLLEVCVSSTQGELDRYKLTDSKTKVLIKDLDSARQKILGNPQVPIRFVYFIISDTTNKALMANAMKVRNDRLSEYAEYYTIMNPPPKLIKK
jgi:hypothetical protein